jgi:hypothetical protein
MVGPKMVRTLEEAATARCALPVSFETTSRERFIIAIEVSMSASPARFKVRAWRIPDIIPSMRLLS